MEGATWKEWLEPILETIHDGIIIFDKAGLAVFANIQVERILGLKRGDILGRTYDDPVWKITTVEGKPLPQEEQPFVKAVRAGKPVYDVTYAYERPDGTRVAVSANAAPLLSTSDVVGVVVSLKYITERLQVEG